MWKLFLILISLSLPCFGHCKILIATVAQVKNHVITSREAAIHKEVKKALGQVIQDSSDEGAIEEVIREWLLFLEASTFYNSEISQARIDEKWKQAKDKLAKQSDWQTLGVSGAELKEKIRRRLEAHRIYTFKKKASVLPVSLSEIETEYSQNRIRYGNESFDEVKEKIRKNKVEKNLQTRMQQWFSVLERKYKVQRFSKFSEI